MKTIEISDEMHAKLIELATEMTTQDPLGTRMPHMFQIRDWKKVYDGTLAYLCRTDDVYREHAANGFRNLPGVKSLGKLNVIYKKDENR
jgi:hypothetical protein